FFPLRRSFDHQNEQHWRHLLNEIQCMLPESAKKVDKNHSNLMKDFFWMVFVATFPSFPGGEWDAWDALISMDGTFITTWLGEPGLQYLRDSQTPDAVRQFIFDKLKEVIEHIFS
ncbi:hypothetical protein L210DRAFT_3308800, partial [Boletus edulis BED1]